MTLSTKCIHQYLEFHAHKTPDNVAVSFLHKKITYKQLDNMANALANILLSKGISVEDFIIVYMDRRLELMIAIFGILKAGGVYVPISGEFPKKRIKDIINDTKPKVFLTEEKYKGNIPEGHEVIVMDSFLDSIEDYALHKPNIAVKPSNLAYSIFTSGSTGKPKGVLIEHHSVINRIEWMQKKYPITSSDILLQKTTITFDVSIWELFWWSFVGASLVLLPNDHEKDPKKLFDCIVDKNVSVMHFVPSMFNVSLYYLNSLRPKNLTKKLKWIFCSGEELLPVSVSDFYTLSSEKLTNNTTLINLYGPTEATVDVTYYTCPKEVPPIIPIGKPIDNTQIYIIDDKNMVLPPNVEGELVICGVNLARGYLNNKELTEEKFINIDLNNKSVRAYKTGDKAIILNTGDIVYKGRIDNQVKIRGFRIELGEIENLALEIDNINECACVVHDAGTINAKIVCYYSNEINDKAEPDFKEFFEERLPKYMIPAQYVKCEALPRTLSGKIDRNKLLSTKPFEKPKPQIVEDNSQNNIEQQLVNIWKGLLKLDKVSPTANFFDLGGNSILLVQLSLLIKEELDIDVDILSIFQYPTIKSLIKYINTGS